MECWVLSPIFYALNRKRGFINALFGGEMEEFYIPINFRASPSGFRNGRKKGMVINDMVGIDELSDVFPFVFVLWGMWH